MRNALGNAPQGEELWAFSLAFYACPGVAEALLALQDRGGLDVNLMLFALWLGWSGRGRLDRDALAAAERAIGTLRDEIVEPVRTLRRRLKDNSEEDVQGFRERVKALELAAEELVQSRLARLAATKGRIGDGLAAARANFDFYLARKGGGAPEAAIILEAFERFAAGR